MKCHVCKRRFKDGDEVIAIAEYVVNERHGDFVSSPTAYAHASHLTEEAS